MKEETKRIKNDVGLSMLVFMRVDLLDEISFNVWIIIYIDDLMVISFLNSICIKAFMSHFHSKSIFTMIRPFSVKIRSMQKKRYLTIY